MKQSKARGRVLLATDRLAAEQPLHAGILAQWRLVEDVSISTMAIGFQRGRLVLSFNPKFVEKIKMDELSAVLSHEVGHVMFGHCEREPSVGENQRAMVTAEEVTVNEWASGPLPGNPILLSQFPDLPENEDTITRYERLLQILPPEPATLDDHSRWSQILASGQLGRAVVASAIAQAWDRMSPEQKAKINLPEAAKNIVDEAVRSAGTSVLGEGTASVAWQKILRRYVGRALCRRPMFTRPPRRFPNMVGILPGRGRSGSKPKVMAAIDSSGSMTMTMLSDIGAELAVMNRMYEVLVVICDNAIRDVFKYRPITDVHGRGGTSFLPVFESAFLREHKPDVIVYFTDGCGPAPGAPPRGIPVIWAITPKGRRPAPWGRDVWIS